VRRLYFWIGEAEPTNQSVLAATTTAFQLQDFTPRTEIRSPAFPTRGYRPASAIAARTDSGNNSHACSLPQPGFLNRIRNSDANCQSECECECNNDSNRDFLPSDCQRDEHNWYATGFCFDIGEKPNDLVNAITSEPQGSCIDKPFRGRF
jgi:hypothetical protein